MTGLLQPKLVACGHTRLSPFSLKLEKRMTFFVGYASIVAD